ncbi:MAG: histidine phosphatase family protein [Candidatus Latescibacteria bacterium]|nr:histidine phosphatase family protein [Candidatus Latescibacterota bacterium]
MASLILIRHGQSEHHVNGLTGGWTDTGLTELGRHQAECLGARLKREIEDTPCRMVSSDLKRAFQTAEIVDREIDVSPNPVPELREFNNGLAAGMTIDAAKSHFREPTEPLHDWQPYPEADTWRRFYSRVSDWLDHLAGHRDGLLLLVAHAGTINNIVAWWLGLEIERLSKVAFGAAPTSISVLDVNPWGEQRVERLNDTAHLYAAGLSGSIPLQTEGDAL